MGATGLAERVALPLELLELVDEPWAIRPAVLRTFYSWVEAGSIPLSALADPDQAAMSRQQGSSGGGTAVIAIRGPISRRPTMLSFLCGGASCEEISAQLQQAVDDPAVSRIVLNVDSPGGTCDGVPELADEIYAARSQKPITAFVDTAAASAAYWLASQATDIIVTPSGQVGSIGVFGLHMDHSKELEMAGISPTFIQAGKYKTEANPLQPLSDDAKAAWQARVDAMYGVFVRDVARGRGVTADVVRSDFGEGRMLTAKDAVAKGMADQIRATLPATVTSSRASVDAGALVAIAHANATRVQHAFGK